jgi:hypothetical protein
MGYRVRIETTGPLLQGKAPATVQRHVEAFVTEATLFLAMEVQKRTPQGVYGAQGGLLSTVQPDIQGKGTMLVKGIIGHAKSYGDVVEKGRGPNKGMPPKGSLVRWIEVKMGLDQKTARRIEFVVRRKIGRSGFPGAEMFEKGFVENFARVQAMAAKRGLLVSQELNGE